MGLLAPLPLRYFFEIIDVPPNEFGDGGRAVINPFKRAWLFEGHFAVLCPANRCRPQRKGLAIRNQIDTSVATRASPSHKVARL